MDKLLGSPEFLERTDVRAHAKKVKKSKIDAKNNELQWLKMVVTAKTEKKEPLKSHIEHKRQPFCSVASELFRQHK